MPVIGPVSLVQNLGISEPLGDTALLMVSSRQMDAPVIPLDYQVVDISNPELPLIFTARQVTRKLEREETGTTFLLGSEGLTVIRRPRMEQEYQSRQSTAN
jgi:hypothetical protein